MLQFLRCCFCSRVIDDYNTTSIKHTTPDPQQRFTLAEFAALDPILAEAVRSYTTRELSGCPELTDPWQAFNLIDAYLPRPAVEYIASPLFSLPSLNIIYGAPATFKSLIMADLAICAASGSDWLPPAPWIQNGPTATAIPTLQVTTMWLDFDNGQRRTHDRIAALARARELPTTTPIVYYSMPNPWLIGNEKSSVGALSLRIQTHGARLVVIDNLSVVSGNADENSNEMVTVMSNYRQLAEETGAAIVLIHHQTKGNGTIGRAGDKLRGHSSIEAALDLAIMVEREELADLATMKATKSRGVDVLPFSAVFTHDDGGDGQLQTARFYGIVTEDTKSSAAIEREILTTLFGTAHNKGDLVKAVKEVLPEVGSNRIRDMIDRLVTMKKIRVNKGDRTERIYSRP